MVAYIQSDSTFRVIFDTTLLPKGIYKVEVPASGTGDSHQHATGQARRSFG